MARMKRRTEGPVRSAGPGHRFPGVAPSFRLGPVDPLGVHVLRQLEDRRQWHPLRELRMPAAFTRSAVRQVVKSKSNALRNDISHRVGFAVPEKVVRCIRRKQRKEVLHAKGVAGGRVSRRRRRDSWSDVDCT